MQFDLLSHPDCKPSGEPFKLWGSVEHSAAFGATATLNIWFGIDSPISRFIVPAASSEPARRDELWAATCFEAFLAEEGEDGYREWNFAPSGDWAAYDFSDYRDGMNRPDVAAPYIRLEDNFTWWALGATIAVPSRRHWRLGLSVVLEEEDGTKSYWALAHPPSGKPDFHHRDCFAAKLP